MSTFCQEYGHSQYRCQHSSKTKIFPKIKEYFIYKRTVMFNVLPITTPDMRPSKRGVSLILMLY